MFCWMLMDMCLPEFDTYQGTVAQDYFKSHRSSPCPDFFQKTYLVRRNIGSIGKSFLA